MGGSIIGGSTVFALDYDLENLARTTYPSNQLHNKININDLQWRIDAPAFMHT